MRKIFYITGSIILINIVPGFVLAAEETEGMNMDMYPVYAGFGFLLFLLLIFSVLIYKTQHPQEYVPVISVKENIREIPVTIRGAAGALKYLNAIYYSALALLIIYITMLLLTVTA